MMDIAGTPSWYEFLATAKFFSSSAASFMVSFNDCHQVCSIACSVVMNVFFVITGMPDVHVHHQ